MTIHQAKEKNNSDRWQLHIPAQAKSGLGVKAYCAENSLTTGSFYAAKSYYTTRKTKLIPATTTKSSFMPIQVIEPPSSKKVNLSSNGISFSVDEDSSATFIANLLRAIERVV